MSADSERRPPGVEASDDQESLEQAEVRKQLEEQVIEAKSHRSEDSDASARRGESKAEEPEWKPPPELSDPTSRRLLLRLVVFALLVFGGYWLFREASERFFAPQLTSLQAVVPQGYLPADEEFEVGVLIRNERLDAGPAFVIAAFADGREIAGPVVEVPPLDTATVVVPLQFPVGDHVVSLIAFDAYADRNIQIGRYNGLLLTVGENDLELTGWELADSIRGGATVPVSTTVHNRGQRTELVRPMVVFVLQAEDGSTAPVEMPIDWQGELVPGDSLVIEFDFETAELASGSHRAILVLRTPDGRVLMRRGLDHEVVITDR